MNRQARIAALQTALKAANAAIPALQAIVDNAASDITEARGQRALIDAKNRRDDLKAILAELPAEGDLKALSPAQVTELTKLERELDQSIRENAFVNAALDAVSQSIKMAGRVGQILDQRG